MKFYCKHLVLGATVFGLSKALNKSNETIVIERTYSTGAEFVDTYAFDKNLKSLNYKEATKKLIAYAEEQKMINDKKDLYPAVLIYLICKMIAENNCKVFYGTEICDIQKTEQGYKVLCFSANNYVEIYAEKIIDTTSEGINHHKLQELIESKYLNSVLADNVYDGVKNVYYNSNLQLNILKYQAEKCDSLFSAREKLYNDLLTNNNLKLLLTAYEFEYKYKKDSLQIDKDYIWKPSAGFSDIISAFDGGQCDE